MGGGRCLGGDAPGLLGAVGQRHHVVGAYWLERARHGLVEPAQDLRQELHSCLGVVRPLIGGQRQLSSGLGCSAGGFGGCLRGHHHGYERGGVLAITEDVVPEKGGAE